MTDPKKPNAQASVAIRHVVRRHEGFDESARTLLELVKSAQERNPGKRRVLYLEVEGHRNSAGGFDDDMIELMKEYVIGFLGRHLSEVHTPLVHIEATTPQGDDIPDELKIQT